MDSLKVTEYPTLKVRYPGNKQEYLFLVLKGKGLHHIIIIVSCSIFFLIYSVNDSALLCRCTIAPSLFKILLYKLCMKKMTVHLLFLWTDIQRRFWCSVVREWDTGKQPLRLNQDAGLSICLSIFFIAAKQRIVFSCRSLKDNQSLSSRLMI